MKDKAYDELIAERNARAAIVDLADNANRFDRLDGLMRGGQNQFEDDDDIRYVPGLPQYSPSSP